MSKFIVRTLASLVAASAFCLSIAGTAHATNTGACSVTSVALDDRLILTCGGSTYYAFTNNDSCGSTSTEKMKMWESMALSAMLAGKQIEIWYTNPVGCGVPVFTWLKVRN